MLGKLKLIIDKNIADYEYSNKYSIEFSIYEDYIIKILTNKKEKYEELTNKYDNIRKDIFDSYQMTNSDIDTIREYHDFLEEYIDKNDEFYKKLFDNCEFISIHGSYENILKYLNNNPILKNKKIIINENLDLADDNIDKIKQLFCSYKNIYVGTLGNSVPVKLEDFLETKNIIDRMLNKVKKFNFSPMEVVMYVFDMVRDREYIKGTENDEYIDSRDLTKVLLGDKIVCSGFANIFNILLKKLGFRTFIYRVRKLNTTEGHVRNIVYINDKKYNIEGVYFFDTTWNNKKENNMHLYNYKFFANTKRYIDQYENDVYVDSELPDFDEEFIYDIIDTLNECGISSISAKSIDTINKVSRLIDGNNLIDKIFLSPNYSQLPKQMRKEFNKDKITDSLSRYERLFDNPISADKLLKVLFEVRKNQYYEEPEKYPFDLNTFFSVIFNSDWFFDKADIRLLIKIFGNQIIRHYKQTTKINAIHFLDENKYELKMEQIKLTKTLRKIYQKNIKDK